MAEKGETVSLIIGRKRGVTSKSKKVSKAWGNLSLWEKNQSMRNVGKGVEKKVENTRTWWKQ